MSTYTHDLAQPAVVCRKCDRAMVGGTLPPRLSLCGSCAVADSRPRVTKFQRRSRWQKRRDHFLDKWVPLLFQVAGGACLVGGVAYWTGRALGWWR